MSHDQRQSSAEWLELVREKVQSLQFGVVQIVVHDRRVTQIDRTERTRLVGYDVNAPLNQETLTGLDDFSKTNETNNERNNVEQIAGAMGHPRTLQRDQA